VNRAIYAFSADLCYKNLSLHISFEIMFEILQLLPYTSREEYLPNETGIFPRYLPLHGT